MIGSIRFAGDLSPGLGLLLAIAGGLIIGGLYYRETRRLDWPMTFLLPTLRGVAIGLLILIITGPVWHRRQVIGTLGRLTFALDASRSMSTTDSASSDAVSDRLSRAVTLLVGDQYLDGWLGSLRNSHDLEIISFADGEPSTIWSSRTDAETPRSLPVSATGNATDLASALLPFVQTSETVEPGERTPSNESQSSSGSRRAIVLVTDGRGNTGESVIDVAGRLNAQGTVVHTLGMGSTDEPPDVGILDVIHPENVAADGTLVGQIRIKQFGFQDSALRLKITNGDDTVWDEMIEPRRDGVHGVPFQIDVEEALAKDRRPQLRGVKRSSIVMDLTAEVEPVSGESIGNNNAFAFRVAASVRNQQMLILDGSSRWEIRYIRNLFERDPGWDVNTVLFGPGTDMPELQRGQQPGQFPATDEAWAKYDVVILGEVPPDEISTADIHRLREFVSRGGGLVAIDGRFGRLKTLVEDSISDLIPIKYSDSPVRLDVRTIRPTSVGLDHSVLNLTGDVTDLSDLWELLPRPRTTAYVRAQEGADIWAHAVGQDGRESAWLVTRLFGAGRVFFLASDETWRWRYKVADRFHMRFWNQLVRAAVQPPYSARDEYVSIATDRIEYGPGDSPTVRVRLQNPNGDPVGDATVDALLVRDNRVVAEVPLIVQDPHRGTYEGQVPPLPLGAYTVRVRASGFDQSSFLVSTPIWVVENQTAEQRQVSLDAKTLEEIASAAGGQYFHESEAVELPATLKPLSDGSLVESDMLLWQSYYWFTAVVGLLAVEWLLRKRAGLV